MVNAIATSTKKTARRVFNRTFYATYLNIECALEKASKSMFGYAKLVLVIFGRIIKFSARMSMAGLMVAFVVPVVMGIIAGDTSVVESAYSYYAKDIMESFSEFLSSRMTENAHSVLDQVREAEWFQARVCEEEHSAAASRTASRLFL